MSSFETQCKRLGGSYQAAGPNGPANCKIPNPYQDTSDIYCHYGTQGIFCVNPEQNVSVDDCNNYINHGMTLTNYHGQHLCKK